MLKGTNGDLPFILADAGYDVWLGNFRGNYNGRGHVNMSTDDENFWKFSFHEMGVYDLPAFVDHILRISGSTQLTLVCHSYSNAVTMVMASQRPEYNERVNLLIGMAPFVFAEHLRYGPVLEAFLIPLKRYCYKSRKFELLERRDVNPFVRICDILPYICILWLSLLVGISDAKFMVELTPIGLAYFPAGTNLFTLTHITNIYSQGRFCQLDLGRSQNRLRYGMDEPPDYDLSQVSIPFMIYAGTSDYFIDVRDVQRLRKSLPSVIDIRLVSYNHIEFISASDTKEVLYNDMVQLIDKYSQRTMKPRR